MVNEAFTNALKDVEEYLGDKFNPEIDGTRQSAINWQERQPKTDDEKRAYYIESDCYIYDLAQWHVLPTRKALSTLTRRTILENGIKEVLDVGAAMCSDAIEFAKAGVKVRVTDLPSKYFEFGKWRIQKYGLQDSIEIVDYSDIFSKSVECMVFTDVLEHIPNFYEFMDNVAKTTNKFIEKSSFNMHQDKGWGHDTHPCHTNITKEQARAYFEKLGFREAFRINVYSPILWVKE